MNWVGGSRNRLVMRNDSKRQREFFEKRKMQQKLKNMGIALTSPCPANTSCGNVDLMNLFIVNQIAAKKACKDPPKVAVLGSSKGGTRHKRNEAPVLPMSPCSPSRLSLVESQSQCSVQGNRRRKNIIPQGFKCRQLSPVLESAFSDNSASDYLPPIHDRSSPFSSTSSASSGQGMFPLQPLHCFSPPPWDTSDLQQTKVFHPFSQPRGMTNTSPWSCKGNQPFFKLETPTASQVLFGSSHSGETEARDHARYVDSFSLNQPEEKESMLDFTLDQSETPQQFEDDVFKGFSNEPERENPSDFGNARSKIYLTDQTTVKASTPQIVPDSQYLAAELSNSTDTSFSRLGHNTGPMNGCEYSPSYSCGGGYLSSDDDEDGHQPCLPVSSSYMDQAFSVDTLTGSQGNLKEIFSEPRPHTPHIRSHKDFRDDPKAMEKKATPDKAHGCKGQEKESSTALLSSSHPLAQTQSSDICKCKKTSSETRDAGTQTAYSPPAEVCDASTQCSFVGDSALGFSWYLPIDMSEQPPATGRQPDTVAEPDILTPSAEISGWEENQMPWSMKKSKAGSLSGRSFITDSNSAKLILQRPTNPFLNMLNRTNVRGQKTKEGREEEGQHENHPSMKNFTDQGREEVTSATRVSRLSEEAETLQEIADILLRLNRRKIQG